MLSCAVAYAEPPSLQFRTNDRR